MQWIIVIFLFFFGLFLFREIWEATHEPDGGITFIAAEIGAGKSCYAAKLAKKYMKKGHSVYSTDFIRGAYRLNVTDLSMLCCPPGSLIIIDEAALSMNSRKFKDMEISMIEYFKLSRHYKNRIVMISQTFNDTDKQIRELSDKVLLIRPVVRGLLSMPVNCHGKIGIGIDGNFAVQYKIGRLGIPFLLPLYFGMFDSYVKPSRDFVPALPWKSVTDGPIGEGA